MKNGSVLAFIANYFILVFPITGLMLYKYRTAIGHICVRFRSNLHFIMPLSFGRVQLKPNYHIYFGSGEYFMQSYRQLAQS